MTRREDVCVSPTTRRRECKSVFTDLSKSTCVHNGRRSCSSPGGSVDALERPAPANRLAGKSPAASRMASPPPTAAQDLHPLILVFSFLFPLSGATLPLPRPCFYCVVDSQPASQSDSLPLESIYSTSSPLFLLASLHAQLPADVAPPFVHPPTSARAQLQQLVFTVSRALLRHLLTLSLKNYRLCPKKYQLAPWIGLDIGTLRSDRDLAPSTGWTTFTNKRQTELDDVVARCYGRSQWRARSRLKVRAEPCCNIGCISFC